MSNPYNWPDDIPDSFTARYKGGAGTLVKDKIYQFNKANGREWSCENERNCLRQVNRHSLLKFWEPCMLDLKAPTFTYWKRLTDGSKSHIKDRIYPYDADKGVIQCETSGYMPDGLMTLSSSYLEGMRKHWGKSCKEAFIAQGYGAGKGTINKIEKRTLPVESIFDQPAKITGMHCDAVFIDEASHMTDAMAYALMNKIQSKNEEMKMRYTIQQNVTLVNGKVIDGLSPETLEDMATTLVADIESAKTKQEAVGEAKNSTTTYYGRMIKELKEQLKIVVAELNSREV